MTRTLILATLLLLIVAPMLAAQASEVASAPSSTEPAPSTAGGSIWVVAVNLVIWTGLFLYLLSLHGKIRALEKKP